MADDPKPPVDKETKGPPMRKVKCPSRSFAVAWANRTKKDGYRCVACGATGHDTAS